MAFAARLQASDEQATLRLGEALGKLAAPGDVIVLTGDLGAGKTTFVKGMARALGVQGQVTSPTFTIVHPLSGRMPLYHVDLYRIQREGELVDLGLEDVLYGDGVACVEWGDRFPGLYTLGSLTIAFRYADGGRELEACADGPRAQDLLDGWVGSAGG